MAQNVPSSCGKHVPAFCAVVAAAGSGTRMQAPIRKAFLRLDSVPILLHTLCRLSAARGCAEIVLAVHPADLPLFTPDCQRVLQERFGVKAVVPGGKIRQESVLAALEATTPSLPVALIHDAVRPLVRVELIEKVALRASECGAALAAVPAVATVKHVDPDGHVTRTLPRETLWLAQTPQGFRRDVILRAHREARRDGFIGTDDAGLVERSGHTVQVVEDWPENIKITTSQDLAIAEAILLRQRQQGVRAADVRGCGLNAFFEPGKVTT